MLRIAAYARIAGIVLLAVAAVGKVLLGWGAAPTFYHAVVGLFFLYVGFSRLETTTIRQLVGGMGVLLVVVKVVEILVLWLLLIRHLHGPIEITCLVLGIACILAARYLPDRRSLRRGRRVS